MDDFIAEGAALGLTEEQVREMWAKMTATPSALSEVTRWVTCEECGYRSSNTISRADGNTGATDCNECGHSIVRTFRFTKAEVEFFDRVEEEAV